MEMQLRETAIRVKMLSLWNENFMKSSSSGFRGKALKTLANLMAVFKGYKNDGEGVLLMSKSRLLKTKILFDFIAEANVTLTRLSLDVMCARTDCCRERRNGESSPTFTRSC